MNYFYYAKEVNGNFGTRMCVGVMACTGIYIISLFLRLIF